MAPRKVHDLAPDSPVARANRAAQGVTLSETAEATQLPLIAIVGNPNVGKSVVFHLLTGRYVVVSNYPGTTVEISKGKCTIGATPCRVFDTPGMYSLVPVSEEERIARRILLKESPAAVIHVVDGKNLPRMLPMTLQLIEAGLPVILLLNLMDEVRKVGLSIDVASLQQKLKIPVVAMTATRGTGLDVLLAVLEPLVAVAANPNGEVA